MEDNKFAVSFLTIGKTQESTETVSGFKKYVGVGTSRIIAYNPTKEKLDELMGYDFPFTPVYTDEKDGDKIANIYFVVETDSDACNGISIRNLAMFTLKAKPSLHSDGKTVDIIDDYGNYSRMDYADAKAHKPAVETAKIDHTGYRIACEGEIDLTVFLHRFLNLPASLDYVNNVWVLRKDAPETAKFKLEHIKDFFNGDFSEIQEALSYQPNNKIKLLYGVKTDKDNKLKQTVCTNADYIMHNNAGANTFAKVETRLAKAKQHGKYSNITYKVQELQEWTVEPTNLENPANIIANESSSSVEEFEW